MSINISVSDSGAGSFEISQVTDTTADLNLTTEANITLDVEGGVGAPGAGNVTLAAGSGIAIATNGNTATISATAQAVSSANIADLANVNTTAPSTGEVLAWSGTDWRPTADSTLTLTTAAAVDLGTGAAGTSTDAARADHVHAMPSFEQVTNGTATTSSNLTLDPSTGAVIVQGGTGGSAALTLNCEVNTHGVTIQGPPHSAGATYTLTLPDDTGTQGQVLTTSGASGELSWQNGGAGGSLTFADVPTSSESAGNTGDLSFDNQFFYVRTASGWRRAALSGWGVSITITQQPSNVQTSAGSSVTFTVAAQTSGSGVVSYQWQESASGGEYVSILGATSSSYTFNASSSSVDSVWRCMVMATGAQTVYSDTAIVTFDTPADNLLLIESGDHLHTESGDGLLHSGNVASTLSFSTQPTNQNVSSGSATFTVAVSNSDSGAVSLQWQRSINSGSTWSSLAGQTSTTLQLTGLTSSDDGHQFRVIANATGSAEIVSDAVTLTYPSTNMNASVTTSDIARLGTHSTDYFGTNLVMSGDGSTVVGYSVNDSKVYVYRQDGADFKLDAALEWYDTNNDTQDLQGSTIALTNDGRMIAICSPNTKPIGLDSFSLDYNLGSVRTWARDNSATGTSNAWSTLYNPIYGGTDNYYNTYGGGLQTFPLSEVAISDGGMTLFVLTTIESGLWYTGKNSTVKIYSNDSTYGWTLEHTISSNDDSSWSDGNYRSLQCNAAGTEIAFVRTKGWVSSANGGNGAYVGYTKHMSGSGTSWSDSIAEFGHDPDMTNNNHYVYKFSRDLRTLVASWNGHSQGQTSYVGRIETATYSGSSWVLTGAAMGLSQNEKLRAHDVSKDGSKIFAVNGSHFGGQGNQAFRYEQNSTSTALTRVHSYPVPAIDPPPTSTSLTHHNANFIACDDDGDRVAIYYHSTSGAYYKRLDIIE